MEVLAKVFETYLTLTATEKFTLFTLLATLLGSIATLATVFEMRNQRRSSQEPKLVFDSSLQKYAYRRIGENSVFDRWSDEKSFLVLGDVKQHPLIFSLYNIGNGIAINAQVDFFIIEDRNSPVRIKTKKQGEMWEVAVGDQPAQSISSIPTKIDIAFINNDVNNPFMYQLPWALQSIISHWLPLAMVDFAVPIHFTITVKCKDSHGKSIRSRFNVTGKVHGRTPNESWGMECFVIFTVKQKEGGFRFPSICPNMSVFQALQ